MAMSGRSGRGAEADGLCQLPGSETLPDVTKTLHKLGFLTVGTKLGVLGCCRVKVTHTHYPIVRKDLQNAHLCGDNAAIAITESKDDRESYRFTPEPAYVICARSSQDVGHCPFGHVLRRLPPRNCCHTSWVRHINVAKRYLVDSQAEPQVLLTLARQKH